MKCSSSSHTLQQITNATITAQHFIIRNNSEAKASKLLQTYVWPKFMKLRPFLKGYNSITSQAATQKMQQHSQLYNTIQLLYV